MRSQLPCLYPDSAHLKVFVLQRLSSEEALKTLKMNDGYFFELLKMMTSGKHSKHKFPADTLPITDLATYKDL